MTSFFLSLFALLEALFDNLASFIKSKIVWHRQHGLVDRKKLTLLDVPGPITFPVFGASWIYSFFGPYDRSTFHKSNEDKYRRFGPVVREGVTFNYPLIHLFDKEDIDKVLKHPSDYPLRPPNVADAYYRRYRKEFYLNEGFVNLNGPEWHRLRMQLTPPLTNRRTLHHHGPFMNFIAEDLVGLVSRKRNADNIVSDLKDLVYLAGLETVSHIAMEKRMGFLEDEMSQDAKLVLESIRGYQTACNESMYGLPWYQIVPKWCSSVFTNLVHHKDNLFTTIGKVVDKAVAQHQAGEDENNNSIMHQLLNSGNVDLKDIKSCIVDYITAGVETIGNSIIFTIALIAQSPHVRAKLKAELDETMPYGFHDDVNMDAIREMKYLRACVQESFRLYPTACQIARVLEKDTEVSGGYVLPAGHVVLCHQRVAALQERNFTRAREFLPERWLNQAEGEGYSACERNVVLPFGVGKRACPAKRMAEQMIYVMTAKLFRKFDVSLVGELETEFNWLLAPGALNLKISDRDE